MADELRGKNTSVRLSRSAALQKLRATPVPMEVSHWAQLDHRADHGSILTAVVLATLRLYVRERAAQGLPSSSVRSGMPERADNERPLSISLIWIVSLRVFKNLRKVRPPEAPTTGHSANQGLQQSCGRLGYWCRSRIARRSVSYATMHAKRGSSDELDTIGWHSTRPAQGQSR
jgi:hypothetical protein